MPDPGDLLAVARLLLSAGPAVPPSQAQLRRAVSTAHYAVFHAVLRAGADRFMGAGKERSAGYGLIYRSFNHGRMKSICAALDVASLSQNLQQQLGRTSVSTDMRAFLSGFAYLQEARHLADYDASAVFPLPAASAFVGAAEVAITTFDQIHPDEKADVLALMLLNPRA